MESNTKSKFKLDSKISGRMRRGADFPQSPEHPESIGTLDTDISFEAVVLNNAEKVVFRITDVNDHGNKQVDYLRERGMQAIAVGQILSIDELSGWDIHPI